MKPRLFLDTNVLLDILLERPGYEDVLEILPMDNDQLQRAMMLEGSDFEDILQAVCAHGANCQTIITNNRKDFALQPGLLADWSSPEVLSPRDFKNRIMDLGIF